MSDDDVFIPPDPEPTLPPGVERFKYAHALAQGDPKQIAITTFCILHDLIELLVRQGIIKFGDLEQIKKDAYKDYLASRIVVSS
jgi:hypothetical protein